VSTGAAANNKSKIYATTTKRNTPKFRSSHLEIPLVTTVFAVSFVLSAADAADWTGTTSTDWNTPSNWPSNTVPMGENAIINNGASGSIATISVNLLAALNDLEVRNWNGDCAPQVRRPRRFRAH
jgi:hypothetical protein